MPFGERLRAGLRSVRAGRWGLLARGAFVLGALACLPRLRGWLAWSGDDWAPLRWFIAGLIACAGLGAVLGLANPAGSTPASSRRARVGADLAAVALLVALGAFAQRQWIAVANPHAAMIGADHVSYMENAVAWRFAQWTAYNGDKYVLHAMFTAWASRFAGDVVRGAVWVSAGSVALLPVAAWTMARPLFGAWPALLAGLAVLVDGETWISAPETTSYALQALMVTASLAAWAGYLRSPGFGTAALVAGIAAVACACSEKVAFTLAPPVGLGALWLLVEGPGPRSRARRALDSVGLPVAIVGLALSGAHLLAPPVPYKSLAAQLVMQRQQQHTIQFSPDEGVSHPDPERPWPGVEHVPSWLRSDELDGFLSVLTTPPEQNVILRGARGYEVIPATTIPSKAWLWKNNLGEFVRARKLTGTRVLLFGVGGLACLLARRARPGAALLGTGLIAIGPLSLMYQTRYDLQLLPVVWVVSIGGLATLGRALAGPWWVPRLVAGTWVTAFCVCLAGTAWSARLDPWYRSALRFPPGGATRGEGVDTDIDHVGASARALADWVVPNRGSTPILDCSPHPLAPYLPNPTTVPPESRHVVCRRDQIARIPSGTWVVASDCREGGSPDLANPEALVEAGFRVVAQGTPEGVRTDGGTDALSVGVVLLRRP